MQYVIRMKEAVQATDDLQSSVDMVRYFAGRRREAALMASGCRLRVKILVGRDHLLRPVSWNAHVAYQVQRVVRMTRQSHQLVSLHQSSSDNVPPVS